MLPEKCLGQEGELLSMPGEDDQMVDVHRRIKKRDGYVCYILNNFHLITFK